jgi:flagellin
MSSILTNNSAMAALQTLKSIHASLEQVTSEVSSGKRVNQAKDNPAIWAVSKVISTDIDSFKTISDNLGLGVATVGVAADASQTVVDNLGQIRNKIIAAQQASGADRTKLQSDIVAYRENITNVVKGAQFNGLNLLNGTAPTTNILASLDRSGGTVTATNITVTGQNLTSGGYTKKTVFTGSDGVSLGADVAGFALNSGTVALPGTGKLIIQQGAAAANKFAAGDSVSVTLGGKTATYTVTAADVGTTNVNEVVAIGLKTAVETLGIAGLTIDYDYTGSLATLTFKNSNGRAGPITALRHSLPTPAQAVWQP